MKRYQTIFIALSTLFLLSGCGPSKPRYALIDASSLPKQEESSAERTEYVKKIIEEPYKTQEKLDSSLEKGQRVVEREGRKGRSEITYAVTYVGNKIIRQIAQSERILENSIDEIIRIGTKEMQQEAWTYFPPDVKESPTTAESSTITIQPPVSSSISSSADLPSTPTSSEDKNDSHAEGSSTSHSSEAPPAESSHHGTEESSSKEIQPVESSHEHQP